MRGADAKLDQIELAAEIVSAFVSNNSVPVGDLAALIQSVHASLGKLSNPGTPEPVEQPKQPAVPIRKSVGDNFIVCLEDGKKFKSLKRHLRTAYNLSPDQYREKWGLPADYPMVAPAYSLARSNLAKQLGLGQLQKSKTGSKTVASSSAKEADSSKADTSAPVKKGRGRPKASAA
jgi:predicted transcriptional regulator